MGVVSASLQTTFAPWGSWIILNRIEHVELAFLRLLVSRHHHKTRNPLGNGGKGGARISLASSMPGELPNECPSLIHEKRGVVVRFGLGGGASRTWDVIKLARNIEKRLNMDPVDISFGQPSWSVYRFY